MARRNIDYTAVDDQYHKHRKLKSGAAGWVLLAGLGVAYVISGDFSGWNIGLSDGGWGGRCPGPRAGPAAAPERSWRCWKYS